jgi:hypothetical protein
VLDKDNVKNDSILSTFLKAGIKENYPKEPWNGLIAPFAYANKEV